MMTEADAVYHRRADRYFRGVCIMCENTEPTHAGNPMMPDALTHCPRCFQIEERARKRGAERERKQAAKLLTMISGGLDK